uniref:Poly(ADP-ribose) polymerase family member 4 n=1 Tax=Callorhinchus milii TaxID=7868 RepID=A0A4W3HLZ0_CALMI
MLRALALYGGGAYEYFDEKNKFGWTAKVESQVDRVTQPGCRSISVNWQQFNQNKPDPLQAPAQIHSIFSGSRLLVYGFVPHCTQATLSALINNQEIKTMVSTTELQKTKGKVYSHYLVCCSMLHRLTARALIGDYENGSLHADQSEHEMKKSIQKSYIIELSKEYSIVTQFTSFVAIEERDDQETEGVQGPSVQELAAKENVDILPYLDWEEQMLRKKGQILYRVHWKGYSSDEDTWEPEAHLEDCTEVLQVFKRKSVEKTAIKDNRKFLLDKDIFEDDFGEDDGGTREFSPLKIKKKKKIRAELDMNVDSSKKEQKMKSKSRSNSETELKDTSSGNVKELPEEDMGKKKCLADLKRLKKKTERLSSSSESLTHNDLMVEANLEEDKEQEVDSNEPIFGERSEKAVKKLARPDSVTAPKRSLDSSEEDDLEHRVKRKKKLRVDDAKLEIMAQKKNQKDDHTEKKSISKENSSQGKKHKSHEKRKESVSSIKSDGLDIKVPRSPKSSKVEDKGRKSLDGENSTIPKSDLGKNVVIKKLMKMHNVTTDGSLKSGSASTEQVFQGSEFSVTTSGQTSLFTESSSLFDKPEVLKLGVDLQLDWMTLEEFQKHLDGNDDLISSAKNITNSVLRDAVKNGDYLTVKRALNSNEEYNLDQEDPSGMNLVMFAAAGGQDDILRLLIKKDAKINSRQKNGTTALMHAAEKNYLTTVAILLEAGSQVNVQQISGETALMKACKRGNADIVRLLLEYGADCGILSKHQNSALYYAKQSNNLLVYDLLKNHVETISRVAEETIRDYFEARLTLLEPVFPIACHRLCEGPDFAMDFNFKPQHNSIEGTGILLFIFHANFFSHDHIVAKLCGPCSVQAVVLNDKFQLPVFLDSHFIYSFSPVPGPNKLFIRLAEAPTAKGEYFLSIRVLGS